MLSVIIDSPASEGPLVRTLAALVPGAAAGVVQDVVLVDRAKSDMAAHVADVAGCNHFAFEGPPGAALHAASQAARAPWLLFLKPGIALDASWIDEAAEFIRDQGLTGGTQARAAMFHYARAPYAPIRPRDGLRALNRVVFGPGSDQGLLISRVHYNRLGGHAAQAADPDRHLMRRIPRRDRVVLRSRIYAAS